MNRNSIKQRQNGFTLIEVMVVIVILAILATVVVQNLSDKPDAAKITKAKTDIATLEAALEFYKLDNHTYPSTDEGLDALVDKPSDAPAWKQGGYIKKLPNDPWGRPYNYLNPGVNSAIDIFSYGADGADGGDGVNADIGNWSVD